MRVLLVEEDVQTGRNLLRALDDADCSVDWVRYGSAGRTAINTAYYAVVLLDLGTSGAGGIDLLRALRAAGNNVPVLTITALDDLETHVHSLDVGADDCVRFIRSPRTACAHPGGIAAQGGLRDLAYRWGVA
jgi:two-component system OmpR family response regulator